MKKIAVIGAGSWGTALALLLSSKGLNVSLWGHRKEHIENLIRERENSRYLSGFLFPETLIPQIELGEAVKNADTIVMVVPSQSCRSVFAEMIPYIKDNAVIISAIKGIENRTLQTMTAVMSDELQKDSCNKNISLGVLSGPSFALETAKQLPTAVTIGFSDSNIAKEMQHLFSTDYFRVYSSIDVLGLELSGALKNVIAIATGMADGLKFGLNARAALITRGLAEITRLGKKMGAEPATFAGLSGIGDLLLTCTGSLSRNRSVGLALGKGKRLDDIISEMKMIAEGVKTAQSAYELAAREGIEMPILEQVYTILYKNEPCPDAVQKLLQRELKEE